MPYTYQIEERPGYLRVEVSGERRPGRVKADAIPVLKAITAACRASEVHKVFVVTWLTGELPAMTAYALANHPEAFDWPRDLKLALVDFNAVSRRQNRFTETVAVNRGYAMKVFAEEAPALEWLLDEPG